MRLCFSNLAMEIITISEVNFVFNNTEKYW